ncbi:MAG: hypothetical protein SVM79_08765, partial [Chloroflexota bacterium]|nr:hypothetical protein [Chloroflexota bacterium]
RAIDLTPPYFVDTSNQTLVSPVLSDCDNAWTAGSNVTITIDSADYREPPRSNKLTVATAGANLLAYDTFSGTVNMSAINQISMWIKSSEARSANDMKVRLASSTTNTTTGAQYQEMNVPALATNTWKKCILTIAAPTSLTQVRSIGIYGNNGTATDNTVVRVDEARMVYTDGSPVTLISYSDSHGVIDECAWTVEFSGGYEDDGDSLLEDAEKATITVWLFDYNGSTGVYTKGTDANDPFIDDSADFLGANDMFSLQVMPSVGSTLLLEKRIPAYLNDVMRLN